MAKKNRRTRKGPTPPRTPRPAKPTPLTALRPDETIELIRGQVETLIGFVTTGALDDYLTQLANAIDRRQ